MECTLVREQDLHQPEYVYLPDILKDGYVRHRHFPADTPGSIVSIFSFFCIIVVLVVFQEHFELFFLEIKEH